MRNFNSSLLIIASLLICADTLAALSVDDINQINAGVYEKISTQDSMQFAKNTSQGKLSSCSLNYTYSYRDFHAKKGAVVVLVGNFSNQYFKGKAVSYSFKIVPNVVNPETGQWASMTPHYVDLFIDGRSMAEYKVVDFDCELKGKCIGYSDSKMSLSNAIFRNSLKDLDVKFSLAKDGIDSTFNLSKIVSKDKSEREIMGFLGCVIESLELTKNELNSMKNGKKK